VTDAPRSIHYSLDEALDLLWDLEAARDALGQMGALAPLAGIEQQVVVLHRKLGFDEGGW
jgi:hypothetical protein